MILYSGLLFLGHPVGHFGGGECRVEGRSICIVQGGPIKTKQFQNCQYILL